VFVVSNNIFDVSDVNRKEEYFCVASKVINRTVTDIQIISCADRKLPVACIIEMEDVRGECKYHLASRAHAKMYILASRGENNKNCRHL
jgi:hypothetical protein